MPVNHYYHPDSDAFRKLGVTPPAATAHGTEEQIRDRLKPAVITKWEMQGNELIGHSEIGKIVQQIPTDYICHGMDENGKPILKKIDLT